MATMRVSRGDAERPRPRSSRAPLPLLGVLAVAAVLAGSAPLPLAAQTPGPRGAAPKHENLFYLTDARDAFESFERNASRIDLVGPQSYAINATGVLTGSVDPRVLRIAKEHGVGVVPLIVNPGWDRELFHGFLVDSAARGRLIGAMVERGRRDGYRGWQFDFEHIHVSDREALTAFYRQTAKALHAAGMTLSIAVMPDPGDLVGSSQFHGWLWEYLSGAYDLKALADAGDFISIMTYVQHTSRTPPGPIAGLPWMRRTVEHALKLGVPPEKISLGVPFFSYHWFTAFDAERQGYPSARGLGFADAMNILARAGAKPTWDATQATSSAVWESDGTFEYLYIENAGTLAARLQLARSFGLRGVSAWRVGQEDPGVWDSFPETRR